MRVAGARFNSLVNYASLVVALSNYYFGCYARRIVRRRYPSVVIIIALSPAIPQALCKTPCYASFASDPARVLHPQRLGSALNHARIDLSSTIAAPYLHDGGAEGSSRGNRLTADGSPAYSEETGGAFAVTSLAGYFFHHQGMTKPDGSPPQVVNNLPRHFPSAPHQFRNPTNPPTSQ